jgi:hypothetical protein
VSWALNDAAIPDTSVFKPLQHAQQQPDADAMQQATDSHDIASAVSIFIDNSGDGAGHPAESQPLNPADPVWSNTGASEDSVQAAAEAVQSGAGDSWQLNGGAAAELAGAAAADDVMCANSAVAAGPRASAAASCDAEEIQAPAAAGTAAESEEALDADNLAAARTPADDAEEQSRMLPSSPPEAAIIPTADQTAADECSTAATELVMLPAAELDSGEHMQSMVAEAAVTNMLESASTAFEGSAAAGPGGSDFSPEESEAPAAHASTADAYTREAQATYQLPAEAVDDLPASGAANSLLYGGAHAVAAAYKTGSDSLPSGGTEGIAGQASVVTDPVQAISEVWAAGRHSAEGDHDYGTSSSISSSSSMGDGGSVDDPVLASHDTSADGSVVDAAALAIDADGLASESFEHTAAVAKDEALPDEHGGEVASNMAQLPGVAAAAAVGAEPSADGEWGCAETAPDYEAHSSASDAATSEAESGGAADTAAAGTVDNQDAEGTLEAPDVHVLDVQSEPVEPQRRDAPAAYDTDSSWDDY